MPCHLLLKITIYFGAKNENAIFAISVLKKSVGINL